MDYTWSNKNNKFEKFKNERAVASINKCITKNCLNEK